VFARTLGIDDMNNLNKATNKMAMRTMNVIGMEQMVDGKVYRLCSLCERMVVCRDEIIVLPKFQDCWRPYGCLLVWNEEEI